MSLEHLLWAFLLSSVLGLIALLIFVSTRHAQLAALRCPSVRPSTTSSARHPVHDYSLFVLGSGGHTKEMLMMMDDGSCDFRGFHRRYLISSGDTMSANHLVEYERELADLCREKGCEPGTYDVHIVRRARRVHQPLWTTPYTSLLSILDILPVLLSRPDGRDGESLRFPGRIYSNGPATGFFVGLAAYLLRLFYYVPETSLRFIYIESWARISTLSLTGKLFYHSGIADVFLVQHDEVAAKYGVPNSGEMVFNARRPDI